MLCGSCECQHSALLQLLSLHIDWKCGEHLESICCRGWPEVSVFAGKQTSTLLILISAQIAAG